MNAVDLEHYQINCRMKTQQVQFLQSLRPTRDERFSAGIDNSLQPWKVITNPMEFQNTRSIQGGRTEWLINQLLMQIAYNC